MFNTYTLTVITGILASAGLWWWIARTAGRGRAGDELRGAGWKLAGVYLAGLLGAIAGAKLAFVFAEGYRYRGDWLAIISGKSITGALLGGYAGVEWSKRLYGIRATTGDLFAISVPIAIVIGRVGCLAQGCCPGIECGAHWWAIADAHGVQRWPAAGVELAFNGVFLAWVLAATRRGWARRNRFHAYLIAYGLFRFVHEFARDDARWLGPLGGYHLVALAILALGVIRYLQRSRPDEISPRATAGDGPATAIP